MGEIIKPDAKQKSLYYKKDGTPYVGPDALMQFSKDFEDIEARRIGYAELGKVVVSTVWIGFDHSFGVGKPLIYETMVFPRGQYRDIDCRRYNSQGEAFQGHQEMLSKWKQREA